MSFSSDTKNEIAQRRLNRPCCVKAAVYGISCFSKYFDARGVVLQTELEDVAQYARRMFHRCGIEGTITKKLRPSGMLYEFAVKEEGQVAKLHELLGTTGHEINLQIDPGLLQCPCCVSAYIGAAFLCSGTMTDPQKEYNMEFLSPRRNLSKDFEALLAEHEFVPHRTQRKSVNVVYVKASGHIEDLLTFIGAPGAAMKIMDQKVYNSMRNQCNRLNNCETANMQKRIDANAAALKAIRYLEQQNALDALNEPLRQAAEMRRRMPDASLSELAAASDPPLSKSGLSHRLKKLEALAADLQQRNAEKDRVANHE